MHLQGCQAREIFEIWPSLAPCTGKELPLVLNDGFALTDWYQESTRHRCLVDFEHKSPFREANAFLPGGARLASRILRGFAAGFVR
jgi:hypothetical protein